MFCPGCHAEYRQGITVCADCNYALVPELPQKELSDPPTALIFTSNVASEFHTAIEALTDAGISFQEAEQTGGFIYAPQLTGRFKIWVARPDEEGARTVLREAFREPTEEEWEQAKDEIEAAHSPESFEDDDSPSVPVMTEDWFPEDLTEEVWVGDEAGAEFRAMVLREQKIPARMDPVGADAFHLLVRPEDRARAHYLVAQIHDAQEAH